MRICTQTLIGALLAELGQRYRLHRVLDEVARDPRRLDDLGMALNDIAAELRWHQQCHSPLRQWRHAWSATATRAERGWN